MAFKLFNLLFLSLILANLAFADIIVKSGDISDYATQYLQSNLLASGETSEVKISRPVSDVTLSDGEISFAVNDREIAKIGKYYTIPVVIYRNSKPARTVYVNFKVSLFGNVVTAINIIKMHETIKEEDVTVSRQEINTAQQKKNAFYPSTSDVIGLRTTKYIPAGGTIGPSAIEKTLMVGKNQQVKVIGTIGNVEASTYGVALENGSRDDIVKVQNLNSQKILLTKVIGKNCVELLY